jgi:Tol biopolymer transport system component
VLFPGATVAFVADGQTAGTFELWVSGDGGANAHVVSGPLVVGTTVSEFAWSPDRQHLAFVSNRGGGANSEVYLANPAGGAPLKLSHATPPAWTDAHGIRWSPDSTMVGYLADEDDLTEDDLFVGFVSGAPRQRISPAPGAVGGLVKTFRWQPGGDAIAYDGDVDIATLDLLRVHDMSSGLGDIVDLPALGFGDVTDWEWAPDGTRIAYLFDTTTAGIHRTLHTVLADGTGLVTLSDTSVALADASRIEWAPNSLRIAFRSDEDAVGLPEIWSAHPAGGAKGKIGPAESNALPVTGIFAWSPDGAWLGYVREHSLTETELWVNSALGGALNGVFESAGGFTNVTAFQWSPDSQRLAVRADPDIDTRFELFVVDVDGTDGHQVSNDMPGTGDVATFAWIPGFDRLLYVADEFADDHHDLFVAQGSLQSVAQVSNVAGPGSDVTGFRLTTSLAGAHYVAGAPGLPRHLHQFVLFVGPDNVTLALAPPLTDVTAYEAR